MRRIELNEESRIYTETLHTNDREKQKVEPTHTALDSGADNHLTYRTGFVYRVHLQFIHDVSFILKVSFYEPSDVGDDA
jgi:hypothetical protein